MAPRLTYDAKRTQLSTAMRRKLKEASKLIPPRQMNECPMEENMLTSDDMDLFKFPAPKLRNFLLQAREENLAIIFMSHVDND